MQGCVDGRITSLLLIDKETHLLVGSAAGIIYKIDVDTLLFG